MEISDREKVTAHDRRNIVLAVLNGDATQAEMARQHGLSRGRISRMMKEVRTTPERNLLWAKVRLDDAIEEVEFRQTVVALLKGKGVGIPPKEKGI